MDGFLAPETDLFGVFLLPQMDFYLLKMIYLVLFILTHGFFASENDLFVVFIICLLDF